jgi:hypothetical protein
VVCVVRSRQDPTAKSEVIMLDKVSPEFLRRLGAESRSVETSLETPRNRAAANAAPPAAAPQTVRPATTGWPGETR